MPITDRTVLLWNVTDPAHPQRLGTPLVGGGSYVYAVAFTADGRTLATGGADHMVVLWDLTDPPRPRQLGEPLAGHVGSVNGIAFAPDAPIMVTGGGDAALRLWSLEALRGLRNEPTERACAITGRGLDREEWDRYVSGLEYRDTCTT
jgi:WD40 repeat protein